MRPHEEEGWRVSGGVFWCGTLFRPHGQKPFVVVIPRPNHRTGPQHVESVVCGVALGWCGRLNSSYGGARIMLEKAQGPGTAVKLALKAGQRIADRKLLPAGCCGIGPIAEPQHTVWPLRTQLINDPLPLLVGQRAHAPGTRDGPIRSCLGTVRSISCSFLPLGGSSLTQPSSPAYTAGCQR
jgi:hypothetical protein